jgi:hypothetical protein
MCAWFQSDAESSTSESSEDAEAEWREKLAHEWLADDQFEGYEDGSLLFLLLLVLHLHDIPL